MIMENSKIPDRRTRPAMPDQVSAARGDLFN
jgi:hypothetical protein